mgnify:CR=1 FL=1
MTVTVHSCVNSWSYVLWRKTRELNFSRICPELRPTDKKITLSCGSAASGGRGGNVLFVKRTNHPDACCFAVEKADEKDLCSGKPADSMVALPNGTLAVFRGMQAPHPPLASLPPWGRRHRRHLLPKLSSLHHWPRVSVWAMSPPTCRSLLLAAEWQDPANNQSPPDQCGLGHPIPH